MQITASEYGSPAAFGTAVAARTHPEIHRKSRSPAAESSCFHCSSNDFRNARAPAAHCTKSCSGIIAAELGAATTINWIPRRSNCF
jgi:hypothetical protein